MATNKKIILKTISGFRKANQLIFKEKKERLQKMKPKNFLSEYNNLCEIYTIMGKSNLGKLEERKINCLIKIRKIFDKISKSNKKNEFTF